MTSPHTKDAAPLAVLVADCHPLMRAGLGDAIRSQPDMRLAGEADNGADAVARFSALRPDVVILDIGLGGLCGVAALAAILREHCGARAIMVATDKSDPKIREALRAGAAGLLLKTMPRAELLDAIRSVHAGRRHINAAIAIELTETMYQTPLSGREKEVLNLAAGGRSNRRIGEQLSISEETVKVHMKNLLAKLAANDRTHAVTIALKRGLIMI
jgi:two-component system NarL family response regulator